MSVPSIKPLCTILLTALAANFAHAAPPVPAKASNFADNPIVYFAITDRFHNGNPSNDNSYGRESKGKDDPGSFHGGDLAGITQKLKQGYFQELGINAIWITAPYEQIHGWVVGGSASFKHYAYHGYYALDYTVLDKNMGTSEELREMIDTAHAQGIRILFDVVMNHPGYADIQTLAEYKIPVLWKGHEKAGLRDYHSFIDYNNFAFKDWWGPEWVRAGLPGYVDGGRDDLTMQLAYLPDFRTERDKAVGLPPFFKHKSDTKAKTLPNTSVRGYLVHWLSEWVREYGVDGFRCDTVKHVEPESWLALKKASSAALQEWKAKNPNKKIDDAPFWMTGEVWGHAANRSSWHDAGFDSMINFEFQSSASNNWLSLDKTYLAYANQLAKGPRFDILSYISSHDTSMYSRSELKHGLTALLLAPGGVQIYYGDESARPIGVSPEGDPQQATRSDMNWDSINQDLLKHAQKLNQFRLKHVALARGSHARLAEQPYVFARQDAQRQDKVVIAPQAKGKVVLPMLKVFAEGQKLRDAYSGQIVEVKNDAVSIEAQGTVLLELAE